MSAQDWYRRALGNGRPAPQTQAPQAYAAPAGYPADYQPPAGYQLVPTHTGDQGISWDQMARPVPNVDTRTIPRGAVTPDNFHEMAKFWKGGQGQQAALSCPRCGGVMFRRFSGRMEAAPLCESCNYNGGYFTQGEMPSMA